MGGTRGSRSHFSRVHLEIDGSLAGVYKNWSTAGKVRFVLIRFIRDLLIKITLF